MYCYCLLSCARPCREGGGRGGRGGVFPVCLSFSFFAQHDWDTVRQISAPPGLTPDACSHAEATPTLRSKPAARLICCLFSHNWNVTVTIRCPECSPTYSRVVRLVQFWNFQWKCFWLRRSRGDPPGLTFWVVSSVPPVLNLGHALLDPLKCLFECTNSLNQPFKRCKCVIYWWVSIYFIGVVWLFN